MEQGHCALDGLVLVFLIDLVDLDRLESLGLVLS